MKGLMIAGILLMLLGGGLMIAGSFTVRDTDPVIDIGALEISKTTTKRKAIPIAVSGGILALGVVLTIAGAMQKKA